MATLQHIQTLWTIALTVGLHGVELLGEFTSDEIVSVYNGAGPDCVGGQARAVATRYLALFEPAILIHDLRYSKCEGGMDGFQSANLEFLTNCLMLADDKYPWYHWRRYRARAAAYVLFELVEGLGGKAAWALAYYKIQKKENP